MEYERGRALHLIVHHGRLDAAAFAEQTHSTVVAGDQGALGCRQRHIEVPPGLLAVDAQRTGDANRHLGRPGEVLDVSRQHSGIEREPPDVGQVSPGLLVQEVAAAPGHVRRDRPVPNVAC